MKKVVINGFVYYVDGIKSILYENINKTGGFTPYKFLTSNERNQIYNQLNYN